MLVCSRVFLQDFLEKISRDLAIRLAADSYV
jgi:hypothetical protein